MSRELWTGLAKADLRGIHGYIARDSPANATRFVNRIKKKAALLGRYPTLGSIVEELDRPDIRELVVGSYRLIYRVRDKTIEVLRVMHAARRLTHVDNH